MSKYELYKKIEIFIGSPNLQIFAPGTALCHGKTEQKKRAKLLSSSLPVSWQIRTKNRPKLLSSSLPVSPSRVLRAPGTSLYHFVPKHLRATWPRPDQSHLLPEACSPNGTDNRQQRQRQTGASPARTQRHS